MSPRRPAPTRDPLESFLTWLTHQGPWATLAAAAVGTAVHFYKRYDVLLERHMLKGENWAEKGLASGAKLVELLETIAQQQRQIREELDRRRK